MKGNKRVLSVVMAVLMIFTTFFTQTSLARAAVQSNGTSRASVIKSTFKKINDFDMQRALAQKFGATVSDEGVVNNPQGTINPDDDVRVIVQLEGQSTLEIAAQNNLSVEQALKFQDSVKNQQTSAIRAAKKFGTIRYTYQNALNGFSAVVKYKDIENLRKISGVKKVTVANMYYLDMGSAVGMTNADDVWKDYGLKGEGTVVAIVDTGIDYTHKDMRLSSSTKTKLSKDAVTALGGPGHFFTDKVPYGYNFADMNDRVIPQTSMHGMHVAGIVAANASDEEVANLEGVKGVAPEAQLLAMKVFSNNPTFGSAYNDDIAAAIDDSVRHSADVINMSLGSTAGFVDLNDPEQLAIKNATDAGVVVVVSGGNSGYATKDVYYPYSVDPDMSVVGSPGLYPDTIQVASFENEKAVYPALDYNFGTTTGKIGYTISEVDPFGVLKGEYPLVYCGIGQPSDFLNADGTPKDLNGKIALIVRGTLNFVDKKKNAQNAGAAGVIVYNRAGDNTYINMATDPAVTIPGIFITNTDGTTLLNNIDTVKVSFNGAVVKVDNASKGKMSDFSSWGTSPDLSFKPEVSAPGGQIYSTVNNNKYETMSGTSMAAPHTAGATALVVQHLRSLGLKNSDREFVALAKKLIINSSQPQIDAATRLPYLTRNQGAGLIQIDRAVTTNAYVTDDKGNATIALKEIGNTNTFKLVLTNFGSNDLTFNLKDNYGVLTSYTTSGFILPNARRLSGATLAFENNAVTVPAGGTAEVSVTLSIPTTAAKNIFAEGFITLESTDASQPNLGIPYMGFYGKWSGQQGPRMFDAPMWDAANTFFGQTTLLDGETYYLGYEGEDESGYPVVTPGHMSFSPNGDDSLESVMPLVSFMRNAKDFKIEILDKDGKVVRTIVNDNNIRKNYTDRQTFFAKYDSSWAWDGKVYNPSTGSWSVAPEGDYTVRLLARPDFENADWYKLDMPVKLDITAPELEITSAPSLSEYNKYELTWTGSDNTAVKNYFIFAEDTQELLGVVDGNTNTYTLDLTNGVKNITVVAVDYADNYTEKTVEINDNLITFDVPNNYTTNTNDFTINYTFSNSIRLFVNHVDVVVDGDVAVTNDKDATSYKANGLADGTHEVVFNVYGDSDNLLATSKVNVTVDTQIPLISYAFGYTDTDFFEIQSNTSLNIRSFDLYASSSEAIKSAKVNGVDAEVLTSEFVDEYGNLVSYSDIYSSVKFEKDGPNTISFEIVDLAGNVNSYVYKVFVDCEGPQLNVINPESDKVVLGANDDTYTLKINANDTTGYRLYVNGEQIGYAESAMYDGKGTDKTFEYSYNVPAGQSVVNIKAVDFYGMSVEKNVVFLRDVNAPIVAIKTPTEAQVIEGNKLTVTGYVTDDNQVASVKVNGNDVTLDKDGNFSVNLSYAQYGENTVEVTAIDFAGNETTQTVNVTMNVPHVTSIAVTQNKTELERGQAAVFTAEATYSDGSKADVTNTAEWTTEKGTIANGDFTAPADFSGDVKVTAKLEGVEGTATIKVKVPTVVKVDITSTYTGLLVGKTSELGAVATYSDGTTKDVTSEVTFAVSNGTVAKVEGKVLTALAAGETKVSVTLDGAKSNEITVKVEKPAVVLKNLIQITASKLNVRSGASTKYSILGTLVKGQVVEFLGLVNGWYKIVFNGKTAYVSSSYAKVVQQSPAPALKKVTVTITSLNVRKGPGTSYAIIGSLKKGTVVTVLGTSGSWYKISYNGQTGYISSTYAK